MQLYRDLRIITARPGPEEESQAPHHLYGVADAADGWSVGRWLAAATAALGEIAARGRPAIVVGGTGLYLRALTHGLAEVPRTPADVRARAGAAYDRLGEAAFRDELRARDPAAEARIYPGDRQRLCRAWEVYETTGRALSDWQASTATARSSADFRLVLIEPPRAELYAACDRRVLTMLASGAVEEARALLARSLDPDLPAMKAVGLRELGLYLSGQQPLEAAVALAQQATRRYAKRQLTWFRGQTPDWPRIVDPDSRAAWLTEQA